MFKRFVLAVVATVLSFSAFAQFENPVSWSVKADKVEGNVYEIVLTGEITGEWHIYDLGPYNGGPIATTVTVAGEGVKVVGEPYIKTDVHRA